MIFFELFWTFFKIGAFTIGGGYAMLPLIESEVTRKGWMTMEEVVNFVAVSESTPGPFAVNVSTYIGAETGGVFGAVCATTGVILPSFIIILVIAHFLKAFRENKYVQGFLGGLKPVVVSLIASAVISVGSSVFFPDGFSLSTFAGGAFLVSFFIFLAALVAAFKKMHPILIILAAAALGIGAGYMGLLG
ncbi:MAG TPA: chromate transporter [Lachnospiraceae bacterium]|nr:chromate transporter [Lachnospiraceae bacterium]